MGRDRARTDESFGGPRMNYLIIDLLVSFQVPRDDEYHLYTRKLGCLSLLAVKMSQPLPSSFDGNSYVYMIEMSMIQANIRLK
jgi:hypothetical protein